MQMEMGITEGRYASPEGRGRSAGADASPRTERKGSLLGLVDGPVGASSWAWGVPTRPKLTSSKEFLRLEGVPGHPPASTGLRPWVQARDGSWLAVAPDPDTVAVQVVTNGRVPVPVHRVSAPGGRERLSAQFVSMPKDGLTVRPLDEFVDDGDHPPRYGACDFDGYVHFRFSGDGRQLSDPLQAFCGAVARKHEQ